MNKISPGWCQTDDDRNLWINAAKKIGWTVNDDGSRIGFVAGLEYYWRSQDYFGEATNGTLPNPFWLDRQRCENILKN